MSQVRTPFLFYFFIFWTVIEIHSCYLPKGVVFSSSRFTYFYHIFYIEYHIYLTTSTPRSRTDVMSGLQNCTNVCLPTYV